MLIGVVPACASWPKIVDPMSTHVLSANNNADQGVLLLEQRALFNMQFKSCSKGKRLSWGFSQISIRANSDMTL